jgi:hypothetical protein
MLLNPYGIELPSLDLDPDPKLELWILSQSFGSDPKRECQILCVIFRTASNFEPVKNSSCNQSQFAISLAIGDMLVEGSLTVLPQV